MKHIWLLMFGAVLLSAGCGKEQAQNGSTSSKTKQNPITAPVDYLGAVGKAQKSAERTVDLVTVNRAIQTFHAMEDRYPKDLQELVNQHYLPSLPSAPAGMRLIYDASRGEARISRQ